ncbi:MAG TPA: AAA family ATPase [Solirubrobacteraceae bacterium]|nr:AAA family ATPase [Solirubrobacteraceae bacterium]
MPGHSALIGRESERERLGTALRRATQGAGSIVLVAGEAGIGKTRLAQDLAEDLEAPILWGRAGEGAMVPYGPIVAALRSYLRSSPMGLSGSGSLGRHLALLLPELGEPGAETDRATLFEAVCAALEAMTAEGTRLVVLDDLQWSDESTLELLPALAEPLESLPLLVVAIYRSDGLPRGHLLRRLRHELRRVGRLEEHILGPLDDAQTAALVADVLGETPAPALTEAIYGRAHGIPFYVEELAQALVRTDAVAPSPRGLELADGGDVPLPDSVRDAVLTGARALSPAGRSAADAAAVAGDGFDIELVAELSSAAGLTELVDRQLVVEAGPGRGAFRHALAREAFYADVPWLQRRALHRRLAEALEAADAGSHEVATHWLGARDETRARDALVCAAEESRSVHAYRDAAAAARQALDLWPAEDEPHRRTAMLDCYAACAELSGDLAEAARALRELCTIQEASGMDTAYANAQRRLAAVYDLQGNRAAALAARRSASDTYEVAGLLAEAAVERLAIGNYLRGGTSYGAAIETAQAAGRDAERADRLDLHARALGLEGVARAKRGDYAAGLGLVTRGLSLALEHDLTPVAAELYQRLGVVLYDSADYRRAEEMLQNALALCEVSGSAETEVACVTCLVYVLRECGEWPEALRLAGDLIASETAVWVAEGLAGGIYGAQGKLSAARRALQSALASASRLGHYNMTVDITASLARVAAAAGDDHEAEQRCRSLLARWEDSEDRHYAISGLRWGAGFFARRGDLAGANACADALTTIASSTGHPDALAALASAIGETALAEGEHDAAADQLAHAVKLLRQVEVPFERAEVELRAGIALAAAGERELALEHLSGAYRTARKLGARPLATEAARQVASLGEPVVRRLGRRAAADADGAGLSRRELEVLRLVAVGRTNREIAAELFLSPRTVDMHVRNILRKLDCRSRLEAAQRARERRVLL